MIVEIGDSVIYRADCLSLLDVLRGADAVISDPPYGINLDAMCGESRSRSTYVRRGERYARKGCYRVHGDDHQFDPSPWIGFPKVVLWGGIHFPQLLPLNRCWLVWDKREGTTSDNQADCEIAWTNLPGPARLFSFLWRGIARRGEANVSREYRSHPTQKPVELMSWCIAQCRLKPGALIVDPYMGTGATGVAAVRAGFKFIGVEIEPEYFYVARRRIALEYAQMRLPLDVSKPDQLMMFPRSTRTRHRSPPQTSAHQDAAVMTLSDDGEPSNMD